MTSSGTTSGGVPNRVVIVHCHMFKNAGSTLDWSLEQNLGGRFVRFWGDANGRTENQQLEKLLREDAQVCVVTGHKLRQTLPVVEGLKLLRVFILRHPIERAYSVYSFERGQVITTPGATQAKLLSFRDYVRWRMSPGSPPVIRNFQTSYCAGAVGGVGEQTGELLPRALNNLQATPLVATLELYDKSMVLFESMLREHFPGLDLSYVQQNVGRYRVRDAGAFRGFHFVRQFLEGVKQLPGGHDSMNVEGRVSRILELLGPEVGDLLVAQNRNDLRLHQEATALVSKRIQSVGQLDQKLADFQQRCARQHKLHKGSRFRAATDLLMYMLRLIRVRLRSGSDDAGAAV